MKILSNLSIFSAVIGVLLLCCSYAYSNYFEQLMVLSFVFWFIGLLLSFSAMFKKEHGKTKFLAVIAFFILSFIISWNDPFQIVRLLTWIKN
ncbi:hypothetical protein M3226_24330 [Neobacillus cucumis]|uniref:hypothetical protein n=1 Tax=Neobacillus cucumis TaxID=1740721 RepID=UPI00203E6EC4|nr:hypothetical protein [Neobacillus cucumis]MCM3728777.1 hypothetical protein [Neobacillus cucumis]